LLVDVLSDLLPREFMSRPKMGFTLPFEKWMQRKMRSEISAVLEDEERLSLIGLNSEMVRKIWRKFLEKPKAVGWSRPWAIYVLVKWCEVNDVLLCVTSASSASLRLTVQDHRRGAEDTEVTQRHR